MTEKHEAELAYTGEIESNNPRMDGLVRCEELNDDEAIPTT